MVELSIQAVICVNKLNNESQKGEDCNDHGTHVAGLIGGNGTGLALVIP